MITTTDIDVYRYTDAGKDWFVIDRIEMFILRRRTIEIRLFFLLL